MEYKSSFQTDLKILPYTFNGRWKRRQIYGTDYSWSQTKPNLERSMGGQTPRSTFQQEFYIGSSVNVGLFYEGKYHWEMISSDMSAAGSIRKIEEEEMRTGVWILSRWRQQAACTQWDIRGTNAEPRRRSSNGHCCSSRFRINTRCLSHDCHHVSTCHQESDTFSKKMESNKLAKNHKKVIKVQTPMKWRKDKALF